MRRIDKNPLGSAAGYGTPNLAVDREITRAALGFAEIHEPVTAVQLSRGKAEAGVLFEIALLMQDLGRLASDVLLFYTREFGFVALPEEFTTGSSIMPQKRNPDVFELVRGRTATAQACLAEVLGITAKLPSGYQRDLQLHQGAALPRDRPVPRIARHHGGRDRRSCASCPSASASTRTSTPRPRRTRWSWPRAFRSARPTGASRRADAEPTYVPASADVRQLRLPMSYNPLRPAARYIVAHGLESMHCARLRCGTRRTRRGSATVAHAVPVTWEARGVGRVFDSRCTVLRDASCRSSPELRPATTFVLRITLRHRCGARSPATPRTAARRFRSTPSSLVTRRSRFRVAARTSSRSTTSIPPATHSLVVGIATTS